MKYLENISHHEFWDYNGSSENWVLRLTPHFIAYSSCYINWIFSLCTIGVPISSNFPPNTGCYWEYKSEGLCFLGEKMTFSVWEFCLFSWRLLEYIRPKGDPVFVTKRAQSSRPYHGFSILPFASIKKKFSGKTFCQTKSHRCWACMINNWGPWG